MYANNLWKKCILSLFLLKRTHATFEHGFIMSSPYDECNVILGIINSVTESTLLLIWYSLNRWFHRDQAWYCLLHLYEASFSSVWNIIQVYKGNIAHIIRFLINSTYIAFVVHFWLVASWAKLKYDKHDWYEKELHRVI